MTRRSLLLVAALTMAPARGGAQTHARFTPDPYVYDAEGRRDPFVGPSSAGPSSAGLEPRNLLRRGEGPAAYTVGEISVRGVMQARDLLVALVQGPDRKTYVVHAGDKLADGVIRRVTPQGLVVIQNINDPLAIQKSREVRKLLRSLEDTR